MTRPVGRTTREVKLRLSPADATTLRQLAAALGQPASSVVAYLLRKEVDGMAASSLDRLAAVRLSAADVPRREAERPERPEDDKG